MTKQKAEEIWKDIYGDKKIVKDFHGNYMYFDAYGKDNYTKKINGVNINCGWNIDHILAKCRGGSSDKCNLIPTNIQTNRTKADKSTFKIDNDLYQVRKSGEGYNINKLYFK